LVAGAVHTATVRVTALGPGPVDAGSLRVSGLQPPDMTAWSGAGPGWSCDGTAGPCAWDGPTLAPGASAPDLTVTFTAPRDLDRRAGGRPLTWTTTATATTDGRPVRDDAPAQAAAAPPMPADLKVRAVTTPGQEWVQPPGSSGVEVAVDANAQGTNGDAVTLTVALPPGVSWVPPADGRATAPWACGPQGADVACAVAGGLAGG